MGQQIKSPSGCLPRRVVSRKDFPGKASLAVSKPSASAGPPLHNPQDLRVDSFEALAGADGVRPVPHRDPSFFPIREYGEQDAGAFDPE